MASLYEELILSAGVRRGDGLHHHDGRLGNLTSAVFSVLREWRRRHLGRAALCRMGGEELRDIGLTPAEAVREGRKPFWRV